MKYKHKQVLVLMANHPSTIEVAIKRLKRIDGLYMTHLGLEKKGYDKKDTRPSD